MQNTTLKDPLTGEAATAETVQHLQRLIRCQTVNPPGNEIEAVLVVRDILLQNGFPESEICILEPAPGRANLVARLRGDGSQRPLLMSGHVDVVPVEQERWSHDPFGGELDDGYVWGRGSMDMKGFLAMYLQTFLQAFRQKLPLQRDLILAAIADEENGFEYGSRFLVDQARELIDAEYAFTEGGAMTIHAGKIRLYPIQVAEKSVCWLRMTTEGQPGHGSMPHSDNAVLHLAQAIERLNQAGRLPVHIAPTVDRMLDSIAAQAKFPAGLLAGLLHSPALAGALLSVLPPERRTLLVSMLTNTVTPTVLKAGGKTNVIPGTAEAHLDCRLLPGQSFEDVAREIKDITGPRIRLEPLNTSSGAEFPTDTPLYRLLEKATREMDPGGLVVPFMMMGATDASEYKRAGIAIYGFTPGVLPADYPLLKMGHGHDERLPVSFIQSGLPVLWQVVSEFCGRKNG